MRCSSNSGFSVRNANALVITPAAPACWRAMYPSRSRTNCAGAPSPSARRTSPRMTKSLPIAAIPSRISSTRPSDAKSSPKSTKLTPGSACLSRTAFSRSVVAAHLDTPSSWPSAFSTRSTMAQLVSCSSGPSTSCDADDTMSFAAGVSSPLRSCNDPDIIPTQSGTRFRKFL